MDPTLMSGFSPSAPGYLGLGAISGAVTLMVVRWLLNRDVQKAHEGAQIASSEANTALMQALQERITALEQRQAHLEERLTAEIDLRLKAQEDVTRMRFRVLQLEQLLKAHAINVPPDTFGWSSAEPLKDRRHADR